MTNAEQIVRLAQGNAAVTIDPRNGCRISGMTVDGIELLRQGTEYGAFTMVPWCGRLAYGRFRNGGVVHQMPVNHPPHAIHGTGRDSAWTTTQADDTSAAFTVDLADPWPYPGRVTQRVELGEDSVTLTLGIEASADSFPAQAGWHPWFLRNLGKGDDVEIDFHASWQESRGPDYLPTGERIEPLPGPWDDCFGMPDGVDVTLAWPGALELKVTSAAEWVVIYDQQPGAVCVEPQSGPPNGLNTLPRLVTPIDPLEISMTWSWQRLT
ncbi:aldose 1-epimerase [Nocardia sp. AB354]|uniref:aldose epimerase family protein n=1 Tax=Nocardia sp. AB354 TaxID=3413283 RepID=UPI003C1FA0E8